MTATAKELRTDPARQHLRATILASRHDLASASDDEGLAEIKRRFALCKACAHSRDDGFACTLHRGCCFGRWRSNPANHCPAGRW
jgi:hypothetical protein